ncbi:M24 family metallopeptidase [Auraticoccus monumenti]|uniref:Xaa-Pro aminopeptidase n=1 Tax=Auraticoccus monumenti TaxID=675864 RepID=A0A1G6TX72_9ACTN|nr:Xaa-Pro peptidase family protein [Auraticoccus monumenti]SDD33683.1 Xaa-Pro aminopeptidase [Auraticoccus monumenti]
MHLPDTFYQRVRTRLTERLADERLDGVLVTAPGDVAYLAGFFYAVTERPVYLWLGADGEAVLLVPELDAEYAEAQGVHATLRTYWEYPGTSTPESHLVGVVPPRARVGVTGSLTTGAAVALRSALPGAELVATSAVAQLRLRKEPEELVFHRQAAEVCDEMLAVGREMVQTAVAEGGLLPTEGDLARHVIGHGTDQMYRRYDHVVYTTKLAGALVYAGPNAARPHGLPSRRRLQRGDTFILSLGAAAASRFVESERTFVLGEPTEQQRHLFEVVQRAQQVGTEAMVVGRSCASVNQECLDVIRDAGLGGYLRHRQGHGIGIGQHEPPWVEDGDLTILAPGMVLSSEPGVYVPGHAGYRISDTVLVTDAGPERLTRYPRSLEENVIAT